MDKEALLYKFFDKTLTNKDRVVFDKLLKDDPDFKASFEHERDLLQKRIDVEKEDFEVAEDTSFPSFFKYAIVACIIIGTFVFGSKYFINTTNYNDLFVQNFEVYQNAITPIKSGSGLKNDQEKAFFNYQTEEFAVAIEGFETEFSKTNQSYYLFYIANAYLALGDTRQAIPILEKHQTFKDSFYDTSRWYLALAFMKDKNLDKSTSILEEISKSDSYHSKEAKKLVSQVKK